jgi:hypothetical protein
LIVAQGKGDMQNFSNKQLRGERMDMGRNYQVMAKERGRVHLEETVEMPLSRTMQRQLGDGSLEIEKQVERAERKGILASKSEAQVELRVAKIKPALDALREGVLEHRLTLARVREEEAPPAPELPADTLPPPTGKNIARAGGPPGDDPPDGARCQNCPIVEHHGPQRGGMSERRGWQGRR